jgi:Kef-type K+ transport system membrane component KefB
VRGPTLAHQRRAAGCNHRSHPPLRLGAEVVGGIAVITGTFLAGILLASSPLRHDIEEGMHRLTYSFFVSIFFVNIGLHANVRELGGSLCG